MTSGGHHIGLSFLEPLPLVGAFRGGKKTTKEHCHLFSLGSPQKGHTHLDEIHVQRVWSWFPTEI